MEAKLDADAAAQALQWVETVAGERARSRDFHGALKDGVLLCKLVNKIKPGSVGDIYVGDAPFRQRENIAAYLDACRRLGIKQEDQFVTADLFEGQNLGVVVDQLFALGGLAQKIGFRGPKIGVKPSAENPRQFSLEQMNASRGMVPLHNQGGRASKSPDHTASSSPSSSSGGPVFKKRPDKVDASTVKQCMRCNAGFSLLLWKHHCTACGHVVCSKCLTAMAVLPSLGYNKPKAICSECEKKVAAAPGTRKVS